MKKRSIAIFLATALLAGGFAVQASETTVRVLVNGVELQSDVPAILYNDRTMLPLRAISEALGLTVEHNPVRNTVFLQDGDGRGISHTVGTASVGINEGGFIRVEEFDQASFIRNDRTLVPVRMIAEATGATVEWDGTTQTVSITRQTETAPTPPPRTPIVLTEPSLFTSEELSEMAERAPSREETQPITPHPNRRMTEQELEAWIQEYQDLGGINSFELEVVRLINEIRAEYGLPQLAICPNLSMAARLMSQLRFEGHTDRHTDNFYGNPSDRSQFISGVNATEIVANIGLRSVAQGAVSQWMNSDGHRAWILSPREDTINIGVGSIGNTAVAKFPVPW